MLEYNVLNYIDSSKHEDVIEAMRTVSKMISLQNSINSRLQPDVTDEEVALQGEALLTLAAELPAFWHAKHAEAFPRMVSAYKSVASYNLSQYTAETSRVQKEISVN